MLENMCKNMQIKIFKLIANSIVPIGDQMMFKVFNCQTHPLRSQHCALSRTHPLNFFGNQKSVFVNYTFHLKYNEICG